MTETARLRLPILEAAQSQKHVTHNEALAALDTLVQAAVIDKDLTAPPASPQEGDCYIVASPATGAWTSWEKRIARYQDGQWISFLPGAGGGAGWLVWVQDEDAMYRFDGADWSLAGIQGPQGPQGPQGQAGANGANGAPGQGIEPDATGTLAERATYDNAAKGFVYLRTDVTPFELYVKATGAPGNWSGPNEVSTANFLQLADTPAAYTGAASKLLAVNAGANAIEFVDAAAGNVPADLDLLLAQLSLGLADALNVAQFLGDVGNRVADSFDALTYVDTGGSTNLDTSAAGLLKPTLGMNNVVTPTLNANWESSATQYMLREQIPASATANVSGPKIRATFRAPTSGSNLVVNNCFLGHAGTAPNFDGGQARLTFNGGNNGFTLAAGQSITSDWVAFSYDETKDIIVAMELAANIGARFNTSLSGYTNWYKAGETGTAGNTTVTGFGSAASDFYIIDKVELQSATDNMTALSAVLTSAAEPAAMKVVSRVNFVDAITLGTDLTYEVSRDGGTTWSAATMNDRFTTGGLHVLESDDIDVSGQPSGTSIKWRIKTLNNKMAELHDIYTYWI